MDGNVINGILSVVTSPINIAVIFFGVFVGIIFGSIPGLSAVMAVCLFLPISFGMDAVTGISLLLGLYIGGISGGLISAILLKIPGTPASVATVFDGGPMMERGDGGKAIGAGILYSFIGGIVSLVALIFISPWLAKVAIKFSSVEYAAITIFSLSVIASLSGKRPLLGLVSGFFGLLLSCAGTGPLEGTVRFSFGIKQLETGFNSTSIMIGFFALASVFDFASDYHAEIQKPTISSAKVKGYGVSFKEFFENLKAAVIATLVGLGIGILPGIGGGTACMVSYSVVQNASKTPEKFGTGHLEGLIASEAANNATTGGSMVPMLTLGIPGSSTAAMLMSGLMIHNVSPGPLIFTTNAKMMYSIFTAMLVANVAMLLMERFLLPIFIKLLSVPKQILLPCVVVMCAMGVYSARHIYIDVVFMLMFGLLGLLFKKAGMPTNPCIIGFILGSGFEKYFRRVFVNNSGDGSKFFTSPISLVFLVMAVIFMILPYARKKKKTS